MGSELIAALLGAMVAFAGTYLLQRGQFRRADLEGIRERIGVARGLRADLYAAKLLTELSINSKQIPSGMAYPTELWNSQGHRLIAALSQSAEAILIDPFARFGALNSIAAGVQTQGASISLAEGDMLTPDHMAGMLKKIDAAIEMLNDLEREYEARERQLLHPIAIRLKGFPEPDQAK
ncbi:MAG TPA: hypothetical protein VHR18_09225 [Solirubrobacterales bacterium]|nr:hypothetical protein [Solirubrobacterales bacterium]